MAAIPIVILVFLCCGTSDSLTSNTTDEFMEIENSTNEPLANATDVANKTSIIHITFETGQIVQLFIYERKIITMNYTLQCDHPSTVYKLQGTCLDEEIAYTEWSGLVNISCNSTTSNHTHPENDASTNSMAQVSSQGNIMIGNNNNNSNNSMFTVHGQFNMTFNSHMVGQTPFMIRATKIIGPGTMDPLDKIINDRSKRRQQQQQQQQQTDDSESATATNNSTMRNKVVFSSSALVVLPADPLDKVMRPLSQVSMVIITAGMGVKVDVEIMKQVMRRPIAPAVGVFGQYVCMPLIAYLIANLIHQKAAAMSLGTFACGVAPGGGMSNIASLQLGGDITLSMAMTTVSSILAFGMIPLWMSTLGTRFDNENSSIRIPFDEIMKSVSLFTFPMIFGILVKWKLPKVADQISKYLGILTIVVCLALFGVGFVRMLTLFSLLKPQQILAGCLMPYIGFVVGGAVAALTCRSWTHIKTIAIETGVQNTGIMMTLLYISLPMPDNILAMVVPMASSLMTPIPLILMMVVYNVYKRCIKKQTEDDDQDSGDKEDGEGSIKRKSIKEKDAGSKQNSSSSDDMKNDWWNKIKRYVGNRYATKEATCKTEMDEKRDDIQALGYNFQSQTSVDGLINPTVQQ